MVKSHFEWALVDSQVLFSRNDPRFLVAKKSMPGAGLPAAPGLMEAAKGLIVGAAQRPELRGFGATQNSEEGLATARFF